MDREANKAATGTKEQETQGRTKRKGQRERNTLTERVVQKPKEGNDLDALNNAGVEIKRSKKRKMENENSGRRITSLSPPPVDRRCPRPSVIAVRFRPLAVSAVPRPVGKAKSPHPSAPP
jgi:hypothetical protein